MAKKGRPPAMARFKVGDSVRVKQGIRDTDYPDIPLGGWAGTISEVQEDRLVTVLCSQETLDAIHPVCKKRCEKDGLDLEEYSLGEFQAEHGAEYGHPARVKVIGLGDPDDEPMIDEMYGILCDVRLEGEIVTVPLGEIEDAKGKPNRQLVADYSYWFWNWR